LVTESWCNSDVSNAFLSIDGYEIIPDLRMDRENTAGGRGGGLLVYARESVKILNSTKKLILRNIANFLFVTSRSTWCTDPQMPPRNPSIALRAFLNQ